VKGGPAHCFPHCAYSTPRHVCVSVSGVLFPVCVCVFVCVCVCVCDLLIFLTQARNRRELHAVLRGRARAALGSRVPQPLLLLLAVAECHQQRFAPSRCKCNHFNEGNYFKLTYSLELINQVRRLRSAPSSHSHSSSYSQLPNASSTGPLSLGASTSIRTPT